MTDNSAKHYPILIVGMARSGTTLVSHVLGSLPNVKIEVEPHALWKTGNFKYLTDEEFDINDKIVGRIRRKLTEDLNGQILVEKSPSNSVRPNMVHAVFPDARIIYVERDAVRCIYSNYSRSVKSDAFKFSIILKKYLVYTGSKDLAGAISSRKIFDQISFSDIPRFLAYITRMLYLRQVKGMLPFGPKIKGFTETIKSKGLLAYHVDVYKASMKYKQDFKDLYGDKMMVVKMEDIMTNPGEIKRMLDFVGADYTESWITEIAKTFDEERVNESVKQKSIDEEIRSLLNS